MILTTEESVWLIDNVFQDGGAGRYTDVVRLQFSENFPATTVPHRSAVRYFANMFFCKTRPVNDAKRCGRPNNIYSK